MKSNVTLFLFMALIISITDSCSKLDIEKTITFTIPYIVNEENQSDWDGIEVFDAAAESSVFKDYKNNIKSIEIQKIEVGVTNFNGPDDQQIDSLVIYLDQTDGTGYEPFCEMFNQNLQALKAPKIVELLDGQGDEEERQIMNDPHSSNFKFTGSANSIPLDFTIQLFITVKMIANPL